MKERKARRRGNYLLGIIFAGGAISLIAVIAVSACFVQFQKLRTDIQQLSAKHSADVQDSYEGDEILYEKITELEVRNKLAKMGFEERTQLQISADVIVENIGDNSAMITTVEDRGIKEALSEPYLFVKTKQEVKIHVKTDLNERIIIKIYFLKNLDYDYNILKESLNHPIVKEGLKDGQFNEKFNETGIYLVELSGQNTEELYFAIDLE